MGRKQKDIYTPNTYILRVCDLKHNLPKAQQHFQGAIKWEVLKVPINMLLQTM